MTNYETLTIGTVGNNVPVMAAMYAHVTGGYAEPARVTLLSDFTVDLPPGFIDFRNVTAFPGVNPLPAGAILDLPVPIAAALVALGAATSYVPPAGWGIMTYIDTSDGISKACKAGLTDNSPFCLNPLKPNS